MFHVKELIDFNLVIPSVESEVELKKKTLILSNIRFGELAVGDKFVFAGNWLVKTGDYSAKSDKKRSKIDYLFFKKDIVLVDNNTSINDFVKSLQPINEEPEGKIFTQIR